MSDQLSHLSLKKPLAVIDIETTGVSPKHDRIIEIAVLKLMPQSRCHRLVQRLNPGIPIPATATAVHGIHDEDVEGCPPFDGIASRLRYCQILCSNSLGLGGLLQLSVNENPSLEE
jgi:DNA polymerase-3 subunit epsilon